MAQTTYRSGGNGRFDTQRTLVISEQGCTYREGNFGTMTVSQDQAKSILRLMKREGLAR